MRKVALILFLAVLVGMVGVPAVSAAYGDLPDKILGLDVTLLDEAIVGTFYDFENKETLAGVYTHVLGFHDTIYADFGAFAETETGKAGGLVGISANIAELARKNDLVFRVPAPLNLGGFGSYDFRTKARRVGIYIGWEF